MMREFYSKFIQNIFYYFFVQGSTFFLNIYLIRTYNKEIFGSYAIILSTVILVGGISDLGMGSVASRFLPEFINSQKERALKILKLVLLVSVFSSLIASVLFFVLNETIVTALFGNTQLKSEVLISIIIIFFFGLNTSLTGVFVGFGYFLQLAKISVIGGILYVMLPLLFRINYGLYGILLGIGLAYCIQVICMYIFIFRAGLLRSNTVGFNAVVSEINVVYKYSLPSILGGICSVFALWFLQYTLLNVSSDTKQIADYNVALSIKTVVLMLPAVINGVSLNILNGILGRERINYKSAFKLSHYVTLASTILVVIIFSLFTKQLLHFFGKDYAGNTLILFILLIATIPEALTISRSQILTSENRIWSSFFLINVPRDIFICLFGGSYLISNYGVIGACLTYLFARVYSMVSVYLLTFKSKLLV
ncbi:MAG: hypothetical protein RLZ10_2180 [Bacteroidota bacterium]|jgi:O-antigen/teichoic acid export membrane protein